MGPANGNGRKKLVADINVTPLVDVMLVLLIIFMITAPMMTQGLNVDLPEVTAKALRQDDNPINVTMEKSGTISIDKVPTTKALLVQELKKRYSAVSKDQLILLHADRTLPYGEVVKVMGDIKLAGFDKLGMPTVPPGKE